MQSLSTGKFVETIGWKKMSQQLCKASVDTITGKKLSLLSCTQYNSQLLPYSSYMYVHMLRLVPLFWGLWWTGRQWWHGAGSAGRVDQSEARELPPAAHHFWQQNHPTVEEGIVALSYSCSNTLANSTMNTRDHLRTWSLALHIYFHCSLILQVEDLVILAQTL